MKMLVSDYDGTLFIDQKGIKKNAIKTKKLMNSGVIFTIATGRSFTQIKRELEKYKIRYSYLICNDGAMTYNYKDKLIDRLDIDQATTKNIINLIGKDERVIRWHIDEGNFKTKDTNYIANTIIIKTESEKEAVELEKELKEKLKDAHLYHHKKYVNITNKENNKQRALEKLNEYLKLKDEDIYVIGNETNDITMIKRYNGYIVESSNKELFKYSNKIVKDVEELIDIIKVKNK